MDRPGPTRLVGPGPTKLVGQPMGVCRSDEACRTTNGSARSDKTGRTRSHKLCRNLEDFPCKKEKVEDFVFKLEEVVETKVAYFYTPSPKNSKVSDHDSNVSDHASNRLPSGGNLGWGPSDPNPSCLGTVIGPSAQPLWGPSAPGGASPQ